MASSIHSLASPSWPSAVARCARASAIAARQALPCQQFADVCPELEVGARPVEVTDVGAGDGGRCEEHDVAHRAAVVLAHRRLALLDDDHRGRRAVRGGDQGAVDALDEVQAHHRPPGQWQRPLEQGHGLRPVTVGQTHLGEPLEAQRLPRGGVDVMVEGGRLLQLALSQLQVALEQCGLP